MPKCYITCRPIPKLQAIIRNVGPHGARARITPLWSWQTHGLCSLEARRCVLTVLAVMARWSRLHSDDSHITIDAGRPGHTGHRLLIPAEIIAQILQMLRRTDFGRAEARVEQTALLE